MVVLVPVPVLVAPPGLRVRVQVPVEGSPVSCTLPVAVPQSGWVMVPREGMPIWARVKLAASESDRGSVPSSSVAVNVMVSLPYQLLAGVVMVATRLVMVTDKAEFPLYDQEIFSTAVSVSVTYESRLMVAKVPHAPRD